MLKWRWGEEEVESGMEGEGRERKRDCKKASGDTTTVETAVGTVETADKIVRVNFVTCKAESRRFGHSAMLLRLANPTAQSSSAPLRPLGP